MDYSFSIARRSDTPEILKLYKSLIGTPGCTWHADYPNRDTVESDVDDEALYIVTDKKYKIVAVATAKKDEDLDGLPWESRNPCDLSRLGVLSEYQGRGIAGFMLRKLISLIRRKGHDGIRMLVGVDNAPAIALYEYYGFQCRGRVHKYELDFFCYEASTKM